MGKAETLGVLLEALKILREHSEADVLCDILHSDLSDDNTYDQCRKAIKHIILNGNVPDMAFLYGPATEDVNLTAGVDVQTASVDMAMPETDPWRFDPEF